MQQFASVNVFRTFSTKFSRVSFYSSLNSSNFTQGSLANRRVRVNYFLPFLFTSITAVGLVYYFFNEKKKVEQRKMEIIKHSKGSIGQARIGGMPFTLMDNSGNQVDETIFKDKISILYFGFTHCPDICPVELDKLSEIINELDANSNTKDLLLPIFVSVDTKRDTPQSMTEYLKDFHHKIIGLTGTREQLLKFAKQYRVYFSVNPLTDESTGDYLVDHSVFFYLVGPDGKFLDFLGNDLEIHQMVHKIKAYIDEEFGRR